MPSHEYVFSVENFDALKDIENQLKEKIFAIEGKSAMELPASGILRNLQEFSSGVGLPFWNLDPHELGTVPCCGSLILDSPKKPPWTWEMSSLFLKATHLVFPRHRDTKQQYF
jgi:hypothetical protein